MTTERMSADRGDRRGRPLDGRPEMGRRDGEDDEVGVGERGRIGARRPRPSAARRRAAAARVLASGLDPGGGLRVLGEQDDGLGPGEQDGEGGAPRARPDDRDAGRGRSSTLAAAARRGASRLDFAGGRLRPGIFDPRGERRRGSATDSRSRKTSLIGVPWKPNSSRSWFSR